MRLNHSDKAVHTATTKVDPRMQEAFDLATTRLRAAEGLSADEQNAVGRAVALRAEQASRSPAGHEWHAKMVSAALPTEPEQREIDAALASWESARAEVAEARRDLAEAAEAEKVVRWSGSGFAGQGQDVREAEGRTAAASRRLGIGEEVLRFAESALGRARGVAADGGRWRVRRAVEMGI